MKDWKIAGASAIALSIAVGVVGLAVYSGAYNIAADDPHSSTVYWLTSTIRARSIAVRASNITIPVDLSDPKRIAAGAAEYDEMCSGCHLAPGMEKTEISKGLYPKAAEFSRANDLTPAEKFWVMKHGIKMTGMPAWGPTHDDNLLWDIVAFMQKLPTLSPQEYQAIVKSTAEGHNEMMMIRHGGVKD
ncbi:MAG TPA: cytochrome c [Pseudolabrys sp.]|jgi:mono/diheme cytochrome c family protein